MSATKYADAAFREGRGRFVAGVGWVNDPKTPPPEIFAREWIDPQREAFKRLAQSSRRIERRRDPSPWQLVLLAIALWIRRRA